MRTTIEIPDEQRAKLLKLAAERGEKGFSRLIQEALERYLDEAEERAQRVQAALDALGALSNEEATQLEESVQRLRGAGGDRCGHRRAHRRSAPARASRRPHRA